MKILNVIHQNSAELNTDGLNIGLLLRKGCLCLTLMGSFDPDKMLVGKISDSLEPQGPAVF